MGYNVCSKCGGIYVKTDKTNCPKCDGRFIVVETNATIGDMLDISSITKQPSLIKAMAELHDNDIIEYQLKLSQFKQQIEQQENINTPKCPTCGSTNIKKISTTAKVGGAVMFGLFSKTAKSQFKCNKCGYKW